jgi:hypothetical protein
MLFFSSHASGVCFEPDECETDSVEAEPDGARSIVAAGVLANDIF